MTTIVANQSSNRFYTNCCILF